MTQSKRKTRLSWADALFEAIANDRRRRALLFVNMQGKTSLAAVADYVASVEYDKPPEQLSAQERKRVYIALQQAHIGKLEEVGLVETERDGHRIFRTPLTSAAAEYVRMGTERFRGGPSGVSAEAMVVRGD